MKSTLDIARHDGLLSFSTEGAHLTLKLLDAILQFACQDDVTRTHMMGIAISGEYLAASDGHTGIRVQPSAHIASYVRSIVATHNQRVWPIAYIKEARALAKVRKSTHVTLEWAHIDAKMTFPPFEQVVPKTYEIRSESAVGIDPVYLARLVKVAEAFNTSKKRRQGVALRSIAGDLSPLLFHCSNVEAFADIVIMPMRM